MACQHSFPGRDAAAGLQGKVFRESWPNLVPGWTDGLWLPQAPAPPLPTHRQVHRCFGIWPCVVSQPRAPRQACPLIPKTWGLKPLYHPRVQNRTAQQGGGRGRVPVPFSFIFPSQHPLQPTGVRVHVDVSRRSWVIWGKKQK